MFLLLLLLLMMINNDSILGCCRCLLWRLQGRIQGFHRFRVGLTV